MSPPSNYLKWPRLITFSLTCNLGAVVLGLSSKALADGLHKKKEAAALIPGAKLYIADALGAGGAVTAASGVASIICLFMTFMLLVHPHKKESLRTIRFKEAAFAFSAVFWLATLIAATVITATRGGVLTAPGISAGTIAALVRLRGQKLAYKDQKWIVAYLIVGWIAFLCTVVNLVLVSLAARHMHKNQHVDGNSSPTTVATDRGYSMDKNEAMVGGPLHASNTRENRPLA